MTPSPAENPARARWRSLLLDLPRFQKRIIVVASDLFLLGLALYIAISVRYGVLWNPESWKSALLFAAAPVIVVFVFAYLKLYRIVTRFIGRWGTIQIITATGLGVLFWSLLIFMAGQYGMPRSTVVPFWILGATFVVSSRRVAGYALQSAGIRIPRSKLADAPKPVIIYGAGKMGVELLQSLRQARDREAVGFVDSSATLWGQYVDGLRVNSPQRLPDLIEKTGAREVLVALPGAQVRERRQVLQDLERLAVEVKILPAYEDLASGRIGINELRAVDVGDLLGRDPVKPSTELLARNTTGKSILVTGAGGSIGSELVRQIIRQEPRRLVLLDLSEIALYRIEIELLAWQEAHPSAQTPTEIVGLLGSAGDKALVESTIASYGIETIYHAAAYKHVPIVEHNVVAGLANNVFGTAVLARAAREAGVERFVFISTDKAVRPTNIMGASKRLAELVLQAEAAEPSQTVFTMVRFGNVLDSSGSVVQRFRDQIQRGGPVTVTHPDIVRYFMSIPEAAELVIQAGAMAKGGEVFVLHMGEPVKIDDLARLMIHLSGLEVREDVNPLGDISIVYTGLRPGEKLYEELLIGANTTTTEHPRIWKSDEPYLPRAEIERELEVLSAAMATREREAIQAVLLRTVEGYSPVAAASGTTGEPPANWVPATRTLH